MATDPRSEIQRKALEDYQKEIEKRRRAAAAMAEKERREKGSRR